MANKSSNWPRLEAIIDWAGMSVNSFAHHIGLSRAENLYQIKSGKNGVSRNLAMRIVEVFPEISAGWLLTGEGSMLASANATTRDIPFYEGDNVWQNLMNLKDLEPTSYVSLPAVGVCDCAVRCNDDAMSREILPGTIAFLRKVDVKSIIPGSICVVVCPDFVVLRRVRFVKSPEGEKLVRLEPANKSFDVMEIPVEIVSNTYCVVGSLKLF